MPLSRWKLLSLLLFSVAVARPQAESVIAGAAERRQAVAKLGVLGSVLMIGAHPDDEHTPTLAWAARGQLLRTGYLSLTRGEGGQNLIGPEQGELLGVIRTQELLAARRIDGAEQFFTRAIDFGFSKSADETLKKWGRDEVLGDIVQVIRTFQPDVIILCFSGTARDGHGHHQASGILGKEAFAAAADPKRFPEQLARGLKPWQAKRLVWNVYGSAQAPDYRIDTGEWNPVLGYSYGELAGMSRSMHRSQAMGTSPRRGAQQATLVQVAGEKGASLLDGIDTSWARVPGGVEAGGLLSDALAKLDDAHPEESIPALIAARKLVSKLGGDWAARKLREIDEAAGLCAGLWLDATADRPEIVPGSTIKVRATALDRGTADVTLRGVSFGGAFTTGTSDAKALSANQAEVKEFDWRVPSDLPPTQPYWLLSPSRNGLYQVHSPELIGRPENPPLVSAVFDLEIAGGRIRIVRPVQYRYVDRSRGELVRPIAVVPPAAVAWAVSAAVFPNAQPKQVRVVATSTAPGAGTVRIEAPQGWKVEPAQRPFQAAAADQRFALEFTVTPPARNAAAELRAVVSAGGSESSRGMDVIAYPHFPTQEVFPLALTKAVRTGVRVLAKRIGYVMGAGDEVPQSLAQLGCEVSLLGAGELATADLSGYDAIVTGVRAYNVRPDLRAAQHRLLNYVERGGTLVVQYNVVDFRSEDGTLSRIGPYPLQVGRDRVSVETAPVTLPDPESPLLRAPNRITPADFDGWIQERGLYFASEWDAHYKPLFISNDPGEPPRAGGTLYTKYGRGAYVFTAYSWFRQLPAGVPGAYRIFANLLSAGKTLP
ncbi:MAG TPA: PIG-L family deacetylase [Bryobacteraceae bacterium]|nr:PIG-L family deacetylase [Bryobacteraceae bacterium]